MEHVIIALLVNYLGNVNKYRWGISSENITCKLRCEVHVKHIPDFEDLEQKMWSSSLIVFNIGYMLKW